MKKTLYSIILSRLIWIMFRWDNYFLWTVDKRKKWFFYKFFHYRRFLKIIILSFDYHSKKFNEAVKSWNDDIFSLAMTYLIHHLVVSLSTHLLVSTLIIKWMKFMMTQNFCLIFIIYCLWCVLIIVDVLIWHVLLTWIQDVLSLRLEQHFLLWTFYFVRNIASIKKLV